MNRLTLAHICSRYLQVRASEEGWLENEGKLEQHALTFVMQTTFPRDLLQPMVIELVTSLVNSSNDRLWMTLTTEQLETCIALVKWIMKGREIKLSTIRRQIHTTASRMEVPYEDARNAVRILLMEAIEEELGEH